MLVCSSLTVLQRLGTEQLLLSQRRTLRGFIQLSVFSKSLVRNFAHIVFPFFVILMVFNFQIKLLPCLSIRYLRILKGWKTCTTISWKVSKLTRTLWRNYFEFIVITKQFPIISYPNPIYCRAAQKPEPAKEQGFDKRSKGTAQGKAVAGNGNKR